MKIKHFIGLLSVTLFVVLGLSFTSCSSSSDDPEPTMSVNGTATIEADGTVIGDITVTAENTDWTVDVSYGKEWLTAYKNGNEVALSAKENTSTETRNATLVVTATASSTMSYTVNIIQKGAQTTIKVSPSVELLGAENSTTTITVSASPNTTWTISGAPDWLSFNKSGLGSSTVTITATSENFSDEVREAVLTFTTDNGAASATCKVEQKGVLAANCRVTVGNMTVMSDGFAADLKFDDNCKGYREAFLKASALTNLTNKDIFNILMGKTEYSGKLDFTYSPIVDPGTEIVYCIAAYGSESNTDGSHKYGPMTIKRITTRSRTLGSDMYLTFSYTSSLWKVITSRTGQYGQKCDEYYYLAAEGDRATELYKLANSYTYAWLAHFYLKPAIAANPEKYYLYGPQTLTFDRSNNKFFIATWGTDRDTKEFSSSLSWVYKNLSSASSKAIKSEKSYKKIRTDFTIEKKYRTRADLPKIGKIICTRTPIY